MSTAQSGQKSLEAAAARLDAALQRLETGLAGIGERASGPAAPAGPSEREAALEAALGEASETLGALIRETREAVQEAEAAAMKAGSDG